MKRCIVIGVMKALMVIGVTQASETPAENEKKPDSAQSKTIAAKGGSPAAPVDFSLPKAPSLGEPSRVTHMRIKNAIDRQDVEKAQQLLNALGSLERPKRNDLIKKAQDVTDACERLNTVRHSRPDLGLTIAGICALGAGILCSHEEIPSLASALYDYIQDSLSVDEKEDPDPQPATVLSWKDEKKKKKADLRRGLRFIGSVVLIGSGTWLLQRGLQCRGGAERLTRARRIEQIVTKSVEVGSTPLNVTQN